MVWTCAKTGQRVFHENDVVLTDDSRWNAESMQTKAHWYQWYIMIRADTLTIERINTGS